MSRTGSHIEVPISSGARAIRVGLVVLIDLVMLSVGIYLIQSVTGDRGEVAVALATPGPPPAAHPRRAPKSLAPVAVRVEAARDRAVETESPAASPRGASSKDHPLNAKKVVREPKAKPIPASAPEAVPAPPPEPRPEPAVVPDASLEERPGPPPEPAAEQPVDDSTGANEASDEEVEALARKVAMIVDNNRASLARCYERAAKGPGAAEPLSGRVEVRLTVLPGGFAANVRPVSNDTGSDVLAGCLVSLVRSWQFPPHGYDPIEFVWPFVFHPPEP